MGINWSFNDGFNTFDTEMEARVMAAKLEKDCTDGNLYMVIKWGDGWVISVEDRLGQFVEFY